MPLTSHPPKLLDQVRAALRRKHYSYGIVTLSGGCLQYGKVCDTLGMKTNTTVPAYKRHRYPAEIISYTLWLY